MHNFDSDSEALRENYISVVRNHLRVTLSFAEVDEQSEEIRQHLDELAKAHMELGSAPEQAMELAIKSFGSSELFSRDMKRAQQSIDRNRSRNQWFINLGLSVVIPTVGLALIDQTLIQFGYARYPNTPLMLAMGLVFGSVNFAAASVCHCSARTYGVGMFISLMLLTLTWVQLSESTLDSNTLIVVLIVVLLTVFSWFSKRRILNSNTWSTR